MVDSLLLHGLDLGVLATFTALWLVIVPTPGPNVLMVTHVAMTRPAHHVALAILGNMLGIVLLATAALLGWAALLELFPWLRRAVTIGGALYLGYLGLRLLMRGLGTRANGTVSVGARDEPAPRDRQTLMLGFVTALSNAQAIVFITSIFAVTGILDANLATKVATIAIIVVCNTTYLGLLGWLFQRARVRAAYQRFRPTFEVAIGTLFMGLGARLLWREFRP